MKKIGIITSMPTRMFQLSATQPIERQHEQTRG